MRVELGTRTRRRCGRGEEVEVEEVEEGRGRRKDRIEPAPARKSHQGVLERHKRANERTCMAHDEVRLPHLVLEVAQEAHHLDREPARWRTRTLDPALRKRAVAHLREEPSDAERGERGERRGGEGGRDEGVEPGRADGEDGRERHAERAGAASECWRAVRVREDAFALVLGEALAAATKRHVRRKLQQSEARQHGTEGTTTTATPSAPPRDASSCAPRPRA